MAPSVENPVPAGLPPDLRRGLGTYTAALEKTFGESLVSVTLYGSVAGGEHIPGVSDVNLLVVLKDARIGEVKKAVRASRRAKKKHAIEPRFMSVAALETAGDVMPIAFIEMQEQYRVLYGDDVLATITFQKDHLRHQCEYQLRFFLMRLRTFYLFHADQSRALSTMLVRSFTAFLYVLKNVHRVLGEAPPSHFQDIVDRSAEKFGLDRDLMGRLLRFKRKPRNTSRKEVEALFEGYLDILYHIIQVVDGL